MGKIIGGGLPVGAYGGPSEIMDLVAPFGPMYQAGTLSGNPLAMAAGHATLRYLREHKEIYPKLDTLAGELVRGVAAAAKESGVHVTHNRVGSMFTWFFAPGPVTAWESAAKCGHGSIRPILPGDARERSLSAAITIRGSISECGSHRAGY